MGLIDSLREKEMRALSFLEEEEIEDGKTKSIKDWKLISHHNKQTSMFSTQEDI